MKMFYVLIISFLIFPLVALAGDTLPQSATFEEIDADSDGYITKAEALRRDDLAKKWLKIDVDENDKITIKEFTAYESQGRFSPPEDSQTPELGAAPHQ